MVTFQIPAKGGVGDCLVATAVIREYHRVNPDEIIVLSGTPHPDIFLRNPYLGRGIRRNGETIKLYSMERTWDGTAVAMNCTRLGVVPHNELPEIHLGPDEVGIPFGISQAQERKAIAIDVHAGWASRVWALDRFKAVAQALLDAGWFVIEVGKHGLGGAIPSSRSFVNKLTIRETADLLSRVQLFLGNESGLGHLAAAVGVPQVLVYSVSQYWQAPYPTGIAVRPQSPCDRSCWDHCTRDGVPGERPCMDEITVEQVLAGVDRARERFGLKW